MSESKNQQVDRPKWLEDIQNNSWNPELLLSGLTIFFIFSISDKVGDFAIRLVQENGINPILMYFCVIYVSVALNTLKVVFVIHLILRGVWVGLIGLNFVYPNGVNLDRLPKVSKKEFFIKDLVDPVENILRVERLCSSLFSIGFTVVGISVFIMVFLLLAIFLNSLGVPLKWVGLGLFILLLFISLSLPFHNLLCRVLKKDQIPVLRVPFMLFSRFQSLLFLREPMLIYQTNLTKVSGVILLFVFGLFAGLLGGTNLQFAKFGAEMLPRGVLIDGKRKEPIKSEFRVLNTKYYDDKNNERIIEKATIPQYLIEGNSIEIFYPNYKWDENIVEADSLLALDSLVTVRLGLDTLDVEWMRSSHSRTGQDGWTAYIDISAIEKGNHELFLDKWTWDFLRDKNVFFDHWSVIPFYKE